MIRYANNEDYEYLVKLDKHVSANELVSCVSRNRILIFSQEDTIMGWLRFNLFWDNTPFCNMLYVLEQYRHNGVGKSLVTAWERYMAEDGYDVVMTSTQANESGQLFWRKTGFIDCGSFVIDGIEELILYKKLK